MKKVFKILGRLAVVGAAVAGGVAIYKKYFAPEDTFDDLDEEPEDDFEEDLDTAGRGYVSLSSAEETAEHAKEAVKDAAEDVKDTVKDIKEDVKEAAQEIAGDIKEAAKDVKEDITE